MSEVNTNKKKGDDSKFCINMLESLLGYDKNVHKLIDSIEELGCDLPKSGFFNCMYIVHSMYSLPRKDFRNALYRKCERSDLSGGFNIVDYGNDSSRKTPENYKPKVSTTSALIKIIRSNVTN